MGVQSPWNRESQNTTPHLLGLLGALVRAVRLRHHHPPLTSSVNLGIQGLVFGAQSQVGRGRCPCSANTQGEDQRRHRAALLRGQTHASGYGRVQRGAGLCKSVTLPARCLEDMGPCLASRSGSPEDKLDRKAVDSEDELELPSCSNHGPPQRINTAASRNLPFLFLVFHNYS